LKTAIYLAHLNPLTNAHVEIINELALQASEVRIMPVIFQKEGVEINSKSFPFNFEIRKKMAESIFDNSVMISKNYTFLAPYRRYLPPLLSPLSWKLRKQIKEGIDGDYFTYTGDKAEGYMLKIYRLRPRIGARKSLSASNVKEKIV